MKKEDLPEGYKVFEVAIVDKKSTVAFIVAKSEADIFACEKTFFDGFIEYDYFWEEDALEFDEVSAVKNEDLYKRIGDGFCCIVNGELISYEAASAVLEKIKEKQEREYVSKDQLPLFK